MPTVNGKEYPYTKAGIASAEEARRREMPNFRQQEMPRGTGFTPGQVYTSPSVGANAMFNELNSAPNVSSQQSYTRQGGPMVGAGAMFGGMNPSAAPPPQAGGWRNPMEQGMEQSFPQMPVIDPRTGTVARQPDPSQEMMMQRAAQELVLRKQFFADQMRGMLSDPSSVV